MEKSESLRLYHEMVLIRRLEEKSAELYQQGKIGGFLHLYIGQEAVSTGLISARTPEDRVITAYRDHGVAINCGLSANEVMAELLGKATGCSGGKGGSMHLADVKKNFWGGHAIVGAHLPIAAGLALGDAYRKDPARDHLYVWRWRHQYRLFPRGLEPVQGVESAGVVGVREQPVRHGHVC